MLKKTISIAILLLFVASLCVNTAAAESNARPVLNKQILDPELLSWAEQTHGGLGQQFVCAAGVTLPEDFGAYSSYFFRLTEVLGEGLIYESASAKVTLNTADGADLSEHFTFTEDADKLKATCRNLKELDFLAGGQTLVLSYSVSLGPKAVLGNPGNVTASYLEYSLDPRWRGTGVGPVGRTDPADGAIFTYGIRVSDIDTGTSLPVSGEEFRLRNEEGQSLLLRENDLVATWVEDDRKATTLVTDEQGAFEINGLAPGKYFLEGTKAADGYVLTDRPVELFLSADYDSNARVRSLSLSVNGGRETKAIGDNLGTVELSMENAYVPELPPTGGTGTEIFYIFGVLIIFVGCLVFVAKRRERMDPLEELLK